jgi:hypothetical protein
MFRVTDFVAMHLVDCVTHATCFAGAMLNDAGLRRVQTASYASLALSLKIQALKVLEMLLSHRSSALPKQFVMKHHA